MALSSTCPRAPLHYDIAARLHAASVPPTCEQCGPICSRCCAQRAEYVVARF